MDEQVVVGETKIAVGASKLVFPTARFGEVTVAPDTLLHFPRGIVGQPSAQRFVFLHDEGSPGPVFWMQSVDDPTLAFLVCEPMPFFPNYEVQLAAAEQTMLGVRDESDALVCVILVVPEDPKQITANLRGPIVIHTGTRTGVQLVLEGEEFPVRAPLFQGSDDTAREGGEECSS
jgi:flagellar assembly factor FliW